LGGRVSQILSTISIRILSRCSDGVLSKELSGGEDTDETHRSIDWSNQYDRRPWLIFAQCAKCATYNKFGRREIYAKTPTMCGISQLILSDLPSFTYIRGDDVETDALSGMEDTAGGEDCPEWVRLGGV
jgi:hypothetical protein